MGLVVADAKNVYQRLLAVQEEARAPREIDGKFGKSRSAEQILEAYKPVCNKHGLYLHTTDEHHLIGDRHYVKAHAIVVNCDKPDEMVTGSAFAWEGAIPVNKYGGETLDSSQVTGKASSYARKYALQNLFAIDDTKDADFDEPTKAKQSSRTDADKVSAVMDTPADPLDFLKDELADLLATGMKKKPNEIREAMAKLTTEDQLKDAITKTKAKIGGE